MTESERIKKFCECFEKVVSDEFVNHLITEGFFTAPASTKYHGNYEGGLFDHSSAVMKQLLEMTDGMNLTWERDESPFIVGMFHDLCKVNNYISIRDELGKVSFEHNKEEILNGHGAKSVIMLQRFMKLTDEEILCIRYHMGAYEKNDWESFGLAIRKYPNVLYTHTADMYASKVLNI